MSRHRHWFGPAACLLTATLALASAPATAAPPSKPTFALTSVGSPGAILVKARPGRAIRRSVRVRNVTRRWIRVTIQPADIRNASNGNADYVTARLAGAGKWLRISNTTVRLPPRATRVVRFTVRVPRRARGGSSYAGIVAVDSAELERATRRTRSKRKGFSFKRVNRQGVPVTIRVPGVRARRLVLRSIRIKVQPAGAGLIFGLRGTGSELIQSATIRVRVLRGGEKRFDYASSLGQLFPGSGLNYRVPWAGRPRAGSYRIAGVIRPKLAKPIYFDQVVGFSEASVAQLKRDTSGPANGPSAGLPGWVLLLLAGGAAALLALLFAVWRLSRRRPQPDN